MEFVKDKRLKTHQVKAVESLIAAIFEEKLKRMLVVMPVGTGMTAVLIHTCCQLKERNRRSKILFIVDRLELRTQLIERLREEMEGTVLDNASVKVITYQSLSRKDDKIKYTGYNYVFCLNIDQIARFNLPDFGNETVLIGTATRNKSSKLTAFSKAPVTFEYTDENAVRDGVLNPAETGLYETAVAGFCDRLFEHYGYTHRRKQNNIQQKYADLSYELDGKQISVECKSYRDRFVSSNRLQNTILAMSRQMKKNADLCEIIIVIGEVDPDEITRIYDTYQVTIWDISNLLFLTQCDIDLRNMLANLAQFSVADIAGKEPYGWTLENAVCTEPTNAESIENKAKSLIGRLENCKTGKVSAREYEIICTEIIKFLFEDKFNKINTQCKTKDGLFRMDIVCALKEAGSFWGLIRHHYNSHFIVFECKNSGKKITQDLIYSTEKYLFNAALRNVSIMISRNGFSKNAAMAADGCLKEHGKLILDITDADLKEMIRKKLADEEPADHLIKRLESTLMPIGK